MSKKVFALTYETFPGGLNTVDSPFMVEKNRLVGSSVNAMLLPGETKRRPAMLGFTGNNFDALSLRSFANIVLEDGSVIRVAQGRRIYSISDAGAVSYYTMGSTGTLLTGATNGNILMVNNKIWLANGSRFVKIEPPGTTAYYVGMAPPGAFLAYADTGGGLPDGVYKIKIGWYRKVDGVIVLYSRGTDPTQDLPDVTLGDGSNKIIIQNNATPIINDYQVNGCVIWMTDANGAVYYSYYNHDITQPISSLSMTISDATGKDAFLVYDVGAVSNWIPKNFVWCEFFNYRMWGVDPTTKHRLWYSMFASNEYDLERYPAQNYIDYPFEIISIFALGQHLYINTKGGLIRQQFGDPSTPYEWADKKYFFEWKLTPVFWHGSIIGLTNNGVRLFDGTTFSPDLSRDIKNIIANAYTSPAFHEPCGAVVRRSNRTEYHLSLMDQTVGVAVNNIRLVLNLDSLQIVGAETAGAAWEAWDVGAEFMSVNSLGVLECVQVNTIVNGGLGKSVIYSETTGQDRYIYDKAGTWLTAFTDIVLRLVLPIKIPQIGMRCAFNYVRALMRYNKNVTVKVSIGEAPTRYKDIVV